MPKESRKRFVPERDQIETRSYTKKKGEFKKKPSIVKRKSSALKSTSNLTKDTSIDLSVNKNTVENESEIKQKQKKFYNRVAIDKDFNQDISKTAHNKDKFGNLEGNCFDLALDKAFQGKNIAILNLNGFELKHTQSALEEKGFTVHVWSTRYATSIPKFEEFVKVLRNSCQFWIISGINCHIPKNYHDEIEKFFNSGRGLYLWGDNYPHYADANVISKRLFNVTMNGNTFGDKIVKKQENPKKSGLVPMHLVCTGLEYLYEGHTIATVDENPDFEPICYGSDDNLVIASYGKYGKRAIIDGGFTRLFYNWDTAGTGRYVKNAASWLANIENFDC